MLATKPIIAAFLVALLAAALDATAQEKKPEDKKGEPKKVEPKKDEVAALKARLKKYEDELLKVREAMLGEVAAEEKRLDEAVKKAQKEHAEALKNKDFDAASKAFRAQSAARSELAKVQQLRADIDRRVRPADPPPPLPPADERLGMRLSVPDKVVAAQLGLEKNQGLVVDFVKADSPAEKLGLQPTDVLVKVDGKSVPNSTSAFRKTLAELKPDAEVELVLVRKGKQETIKAFKVPAAAPKG